MTTIIPALCRACVRRDGPEAGTCRAFPAGIPADILLFGNDHRFPRGDEQGGLVFAQADTDEAREAFAAWERFTAAGSEDARLPRP